MPALLPVTYLLLPAKTGTFPPSDAINARLDLWLLDNTTSAEGMVENPCSGCQRMLVTSLHQLRNPQEDNSFQILCNQIHYYPLKAGGDV